MPKFSQKKMFNEEIVYKRWILEQNSWTRSSCSILTVLIKLLILKRLYLSIENMLLSLNNRLTHFSQQFLINLKEILVLKSTSESKKYEYSHILHNNNKMYII